MRTLIFTLILLIGIVGLSWYTLSYLDNSSQEMLTLINNLENNIKSESWSDTEIPLKDIVSRWDKVEKSWTIVLDHRETDEIELTLARLKSFINSQEQGDALAELSALRFLLEHIPGKEKLLLRNIF